MAVDVAKATGDCELLIVGEYFNYSKDFWNTAQQVGLLISFIVYLHNFTKNFKTLGPVLV